ncbi:hypothetical protein EHW99_1671 [Erwinia amylovora]|uniref:Uncharacterized protein n=3 Tax=Erwinia amylovora TaxID=552 RepID=A0A831A1S7_ERWAM|nr:hypothetical protein EaACW_1925 [Erwinia amylovora ACW56400]QJQ54375.1 hypothetical protein EHX00_1671 [Erwinia amylovora]CBA20864.1 hypothetical protein predicted by Glimmer/Critica [Erwinia amylovora CFBP1430]CBX80789.1 hypothetical protein predicted by Glimmer/Critica [Erwinia amylovora ATCC BAA-2158]CCO78772.1 hypothetical protein BN432_1974 [Erwinia amylovora Ea356]CCO82570.1 hypothetical protein BN433_2000 [Erwinia amylovora Ea266]CCO86351.1 hypothetical protein BN434_1963 [Erwinia a
MLKKKPALCGPEYLHNVLTVHDRFARQGEMRHQPVIELNKYAMRQIPCL